MPRVVRDELDPPQAVDLVQSGQQVGEPQRPAFAGVSLIAVDRLAQERDFQAAVGGQAADFGHDLGGGAALLRAADLGHDAVGAELVAAEHDPHHGLERRWPAIGRTGRIELGETLLDQRAALVHAVEAHFQSRLAVALGGHFLQDLRQAVDLARPDDQVDVCGAAEDQVLVLLGHAAQDADDGFGLSLFQRTQAAQGAVDLVFGMLPHAARVVQDRVGVARTIDQLVARLDAGRKRSVRCPARSSGSRRFRCRRVWS